MKKRWVVLIGLAAFALGILGTVFAGPPLAKTVEYLAVRFAEPSVYDFVNLIEAVRPELLVIDVGNTAASNYVWVIHDRSAVDGMDDEEKDIFYANQLAEIFASLGMTCPNRGLYIVVYADLAPVFTIKGWTIGIGSAVTYGLRLDSMLRLIEADDKAALLDELVREGKLLVDPRQGKAPDRILKRPPGYPWPWE